MFSATGETGETTETDDDTGDTGDSGEVGDSGCWGVSVEESSDKSWLVRVDDDDGEKGAKEEVEAEVGVWVCEGDLGVFSVSKPDVVDANCHSFPLLKLIPFSSVSEQELEPELPLMGCW